MNPLLKKPQSVLLVAASDERADSIRPMILAGSATNVVTARDTDEVIAVLAERDDVGVVVVTDDVDDATVEECCAVVAETDDRMPVVASVATGDETAAHRATVAGASTYLPAGVDDEVATDVVDEALETYDRRRRAAAESSMFATLLDDVHRSIYVKDDEARVLRQSNVPGGEDPDAAIGKTDLEIYGQFTDEAAEMYEDDLQVIESGDPIRKKLEKVDYADATRWHETTKVPWYWPDDEVGGLVGVTVDVTDRANLELELEKRRKQIESYTEYVSHDLRTPLQVASGNLELASETGDEAAFRKIERALERIGEIIDDLSALHQKQVTSVTVDTSDESFPVDDPLPIVDIVEAIWEITQRGRATLDVQLPEEAYLYAEESSVRPIFENLFKNAIDHGGDDVTVTVGATDEGGFYVEDDGPGIPEDMRDRVFERGFTMSEDGSGSGLSIVEETARKRGWDLEVRTGEDGGARFEFSNCAIVIEPSLDVTPTDTHEIRTSTDVGDTRLAGEFTRSEDAGVTHVVGGGANIWGKECKHHFAYVHVEHPVRIEGRILNVENTDEYAKGGFMVRSDLEWDGVYGYIGITPEHGSEFIWRGNSQQRTTTHQLKEAPDRFSWYRIDCLDDTVHLAVSEDGSDWRYLDHRHVALGAETYVGLVACSRSPDERTTATFDDVVVSELLVD